MHKTILSIFDEECSHLEIDSSLVKKIEKYKFNIVNKNEDSIKFFGGNLLGVHVIKFLPQDRDVWFSDIMEAFETPLNDKLRPHILSLPGMYDKFKIALDIMNNSCIYLAHKIINSTLNEKEKHDTLLNIFIILQYKYLTSLLSQRFKYPADKGIAEATYASLSYKFAIKQYGSWYALLEGWANKIISKDSIHYFTLMKMNVDKDVIYMMNDTQGRVRDMVKNIYDVHMRMKNNKIRINTTSSIVSYDGEAILKDKSHSLLAYTRYINSIVSDNNSFIKEELTSIIEKIMHTMPAKLFHETLEWMSKNYRNSNVTVIEEVIEEVTLHSFDYINENKDLIRSNVDIAGLLIKLRGAYMSSRSIDPALMQLRSKMESIVKHATGISSDSLIASIRTGCLLYIVARTYTQKHYNTTF